MPAVLTEIRDFIAIVTLNRPAIHNAINAETLCSLADAWGEKLDANGNVRVVYVDGGYTPS